MSSRAEAAASPLAAAVAERTLATPDDAALVAAVRRLEAATRGALVGLVFFGSRRTGATGKDAWSAHDVFVLVEGYRAFYRAAFDAGLSGKRPGLLALASSWLPPTQYSLRFEPEGVHVKASVLRYETYRRETSRRRRDHFCTGRLFQPTCLLQVRDEAARQGILDGLVAAVRETWEWSRPWLPSTFDAAAYGRSVLRTSMRWEVRPEPAGRADLLWEAQRELQLPVLNALLGELAERGEVVPAAAGTSRPARPVGVLERLRLELYFRRSMARATARWLKHTVTFEGWLDYILHKASRHTGQSLDLSERERRWPLLFLWSRVFRYLRTKNRKEGPR